MGVLAQQLSHCPPSPRVVRPDLDIPVEVDALCMRALEKDRSRRPSSAAAFQAELAAMLDGHPTSGGTRASRQASPAMGASGPRAVTLSGAQGVDVSEGSGVFGAAGAITEPAPVEPETTEHVVASRGESREVSTRIDHRTETEAGSSESPPLDLAPSANVDPVFEVDTSLVRSPEDEGSSSCDGGKTSPSMMRGASMAGSDDVFGQRRTDVFRPSDPQGRGAFWKVVLATLAAVGAALWLGWA